MFILKPQDDNGNRPSVITLKAKFMFFVVVLRTVFDTLCNIK